MNEFEIIKTYFEPLTMGHGALDNDATVLDIPDQMQVVVSSDTLNAGRHFMKDASPEEIANKVMRVNLSDLAAMGAAPLCYQMNIAFPEEPSKDWLQRYSFTLMENQIQHKIFCSGGDTTSIDGPLSISITIMGLAKKGKAWSRSGAKEGDGVFLSGPVGDAWIGLQILRGDLKTQDDDYFIDAYYRPDIRFIKDVHVHAAIDVSDGFVSDLGHICDASKVGAEINLRDIPFSEPAQKLLDQGIVKPEQLLSGGDDYRLVLIVPDDHTIEGCARIGTVKGNDLIVKDENGDSMAFEHTGWSHF